MQPNECQISDVEEGYDYEDTETEWDVLDQQYETSSESDEYTATDDYLNQHPSNHQQQHYFDPTKITTSLPLLPFQNQVGGHASFFRFSKRAICKPVSSKEQQFYEHIDAHHHELLPFTCQYMGVLNVTYRTAENLVDPPVPEVLFEKNKQLLRDWRACHAYQKKYNHHSGHAHHQRHRHHHYKHPHQLKNEQDYDPPRRHSGSSPNHTNNSTGTARKVSRSRSLHITDENENGRLRLKKFQEQVLREVFSPKALKERLMQAEDWRRKNRRLSSASTVSLKELKSPNSWNNDEPYTRDNFLTAASTTDTAYPTSTPAVASNGNTDTGSSGNTKVDSRNGRKGASSEINLPHSFSDGLPVNSTHPNTDRKLWTDENLIAEGGRSMPILSEMTSFCSGAISKFAGANSGSEDDYDSVSMNSINSGSHSVSGSSTVDVTAGSAPSLLANSTTFLTDSIDHMTIEPRKPSMSGSTISIPELSKAKSRKAKRRSIIRNDTGDADAENDTDDQIFTMDDFDIGKATHSPLNQSQQQSLPSPPLLQIDSSFLKGQALSAQQQQLDSNDHFESNNKNATNLQEQQQQQQTPDNPWSLQIFNRNLQKMRSNSRKQQQQQQQQQSTDDFQEVQKYILIEDLTDGIKYPCVLDLKMGTRQYGVFATREKMRSQTIKCEKSTSKVLGVRVCGMQVYDTNTREFVFQDKYYGRTLTPKTFVETLEAYLNNGKGCQIQHIPVIIRKLRRLARIVKAMDDYRFYSSSLLMIYDGQSSAIIPDSNDGNNSSNDSSKIKKIDVRIIDFANYKLQLLRPHLMPIAVDYERARFEAWLSQEQQRFSAASPSLLAKTQTWLTRSADKLCQEAAQRNPENIQPQKNNKPSHDAILEEAFLSLLCQPALISRDNVSETLLLDVTRLIQFQNEIQAITIVGALVMIAKTFGSNVNENSMLELVSRLFTMLEDNSTIDHLSAEITRVVLVRPEQHAMLKNIVDKTLNQKDTIFNLILNRVAKVIKSTIHDRKFVSSAVLESNGLQYVQSQLQATALKIQRLVNHNRKVYATWYDEIITKAVNDNLALGEQQQQ